MCELHAKQWSQKKEKLVAILCNFWLFCKNRIFKHLPELSALRALQCVTSCGRKTNQTLGCCLSLPIEIHQAFHNLVHSLHNSFYYFEHHIFSSSDTLVKFHVADLRTFVILVILRLPSLKSYRQLCTNDVLSTGTRHTSSKLIADLLIFECLKTEIALFIGRCDFVGVDDCVRVGENDCDSEVNVDSNSAGGTDIAHLNHDDGDASFHGSLATLELG